MSLPIIQLGVLAVLFSTIRSRAIAVGLVPAVFLVAMLVVAGMQWNQTNGIAALIRSSDALLARVQDLGQSTVVMQRDMRSYIAKPNASTRAAYEHDIDLVHRAEDALTLAARSNPAQMPRARDLVTLINVAVPMLDRYVQLLAAGKKAAAEALLQTPQARAIGDRYNNDLVAFNQAEGVAKFKEWEELRSRSQWLGTTTIGIAILGFICTLFALWRLGIHITRYYDSTTASMREREAQLQKYRLLAEHTQDIILFTRRSDRMILDANAAADAYGYEREDLIGLNASQIRAPQVRDKIEDDLKNVNEHGVTYETIHCRKDGSEFPVELTAETITIGGEPVIVSIIRDISERKIAEQRVHEAFSHALEASTLKSQFVATMSHEIRTPMNAVIGMTELLLDSGLSEEQLRCATIIRDSGQLLLNLINDILDFSRIEAKRVDLELVQFPVVQLVESIATLLSRQAAERSLSLMSYIDPAIPRELVGDPGRLRQVLVNLVGNALKFTSKGSVIASVELVERNAERVRLRFSVEDTGIGIPSEAIDHLFEPFRQADGSTTRKYGGSGLGLSISRGLVELMGGTFTVKSTEGVGSRFSFDLDFRYVASVEGERPLEKDRVLVIDDDPITRDVFLRYFRSWKIRADSVSGGVEAIAMMRHAIAHDDAYTIAIVDLAMPGMDGFELGSIILQDPVLQRTRLIMVTAYDRIGQGRKAISAGFSAYLSKPLRQSELYDSLVDAKPAELPSEIAATSMPATTQSGRVLIAEDNATNRQLALLQLQKLGISAEAVADGHEAVAAAVDGRFSAILMDCQMPNMDGFEATRYIRKAEARTGGHIRIIAMTANALAEDRLACIAAGMDDYLSKPVTLEGLRRVLLAERDGENAAPAPPPAILNVERLLDLFENDRDRTLLFLDEALPKLRDVVTRLHDAHSRDEKRSAAHELKGAAANLGAEDLAHAAAEFEGRLSSNGGNASLSGIDAALARLNVATMELSRGVAKNTG